MCFGRPKNFGECTVLRGVCCSIRISKIRRPVINWALVASWLSKIFVSRAHTHIHGRRSSVNLHVESEIALPNRSAKSLAGRIHCHCHGRILDFDVRLWPKSPFSAFALSYFFSPWNSFHFRGPSLVHSAIWLITFLPMQFWNSDQLIRNKFTNIDWMLAARVQFTISRLPNANNGRAHRPMPNAHAIHIQFIRYTAVNSIW